MLSYHSRLCVLILFLSCSILLSAQDFKSAKLISPDQLPSGAAILASADLNKDGISDVVYTVPTTSGGSGLAYSSFGVALGSRTGFHVSAVYAQRLSHVAIADINHDGKPDIVATIDNGATAQLATYLSHGDGTFEPPVIIDVVTNAGLWPYTMSVVVGDCNGDGTPDILVSDSNGNIFFFPGNGDGTVKAGTSFRGRFMNPYQMNALVDVNRDGKLDLIVSVVMGAMVEVRLGNGDGTFQAEQPVPGTYNYDPVLADFNGDGILDMATTTVITEDDSFAAVIFVGNGDGTFTQVNSFKHSSVWGTLLDTRDVDGDGKPDLIFDDANGFIICFGDGTGNFSAPVTYSVPRWGSSGATMGDFDGDGILDILGAVNYSDAMVYLLRGFPGGKFEGADALDVKGAPTSLATADLNHDGFPDLVASSAAGTVVMLSKSDGSFQSYQDAVPGGDQLFLSDLDGDGQLDALYVGSSPFPSAIQFRHGNGDGTFANPVDTSIPYGAASASLGDINGDGKLDLVGLTIYGSLAVWDGTGDGRFASTPTYYYPFGGTFSTRTLVVDLNRDGYNDVLTVKNSNITVLFGTAAGTLAPETGSYTGSDFAVADVNGDGKPDLVVISADPANKGIIVYLGDGAGSFGQSFYTATSRAYTRLTISDLDLDGKPDVILTGNNQLAVMYGDGLGGFGPERVFLAGELPVSPVVADWNHDGAPDFAVASSTGASPSPQSIAFFFNRAGDSTVLSLSDNTAQYGQPVTVNATVIPTVLGSPTPGGNVSISFDGVPTLHGSLSSGSYSALLGTMGVGNHILAGTYAGDGKFLPKTFSPISLTVTKATTATSVVASANPAILGSPIQFTVSVQPAFTGVPTGNVTLWEGATLLGTTAVNANGRAVFSLGNLSHGDHTLSARYEGDGNFVASTSAGLNQKVLYPTTVSIASDVASALVGTPVTFTADVSSPYGTPGGTVVFYGDGQSLGQGTIAAGKATLRVSTLSQGTHSFTASYQGDASFVNANSNVFTQVITDFSVAAENGALTLSAGSSGSYTLNVAPLSGFSGTVSFTCSGAPALATCTVSPTDLQVNGGSASATVTVTTTGPNHALLQRDGSLPLAQRLSVLLATMVIGLFGFFEGLGKRTRIAILLCLIVLIVCSMTACGGGGSTPPTPQTPPGTATPSGTSTLLVTARTTAAGITSSHVVPLTLTIR